MFLCTPCLFTCTSAHPSWVWYTVEMGCRLWRSARFDCENRIITNGEGKCYRTSRHWASERGFPKKGKIWVEFYYVIGWYTFLEWVHEHPALLLPPTIPISPEKKKRNLYRISPFHSPQWLALGGHTSLSRPVRMTSGPYAAFLGNRGLLFLLDVH